MDYKKLTAQARGVEPSELVIKNARVPNLFSYEIEEADVAVCGSQIVAVGKGYHGAREIDAGGRYLVPGFIEAHCHIESTMLTPEGFAELVLPHGTTTVFADPHEIANTSSFEGLRFMYKACRGLPVDIFLNAPSCVPASTFETPHEVLGPDSIVKMFADGTCYALGEMMNYPGVIYGDQDTWEKIEASGDQPRNGHAPLLAGNDLNAYMLSRCNSDHECSTCEEAIGKLRRGCWVMLRYGAAEHNLPVLAPIIREDERRASRCMLVSDDLTAAILHDDGHVDRLLRHAVAAGISPISALRMVTLNPAEYNRLYDRGAIAPGYRADMVLVEDLESFKVLRVWKNGQPAAVPEGGFPRCHNWPGISFNRCPVGPDDLRVPAQPTVRAIGLLPNDVITQNLTEQSVVSDGQCVASAERDLAKMAVVNRNTPEKRVGLGFLKGLGLKHGAIGSSVAHDAHNFSVIGMDDESMLTALAALREKGGLVVADGKRVIYQLALPIAGLMSDLSAEELVAEYAQLLAAVRTLGTTLPNPFMHIAFLSLSVIPTLKLTDQGYVDLTQGGKLSI